MKCLKAYFDIWLFWVFSAIIEEIMTAEDEELMLDNFVTFFIAGNFILEGFFFFFLDEVENIN